MFQLDALQRVIDISIGNLEQQAHCALDSSLHAAHGVEPGTFVSLLLGSTPCSQSLPLSQFHVHMIQEHLDDSLRMIGPSRQSAGGSILADPGALQEPDGYPGAHKQGYPEADICHAQPSAGAFLSPHSYLPW